LRDRDEGGRRSASATVNERTNQEVGHAKDRCIRFQIRPIETIPLHAHDRQDITPLTV
jgi:hypothetical protein